MKKLIRSSKRFEIFILFGSEDFLSLPCLVLTKIIRKSQLILSISCHTIRMPTYLVCITSLLNGDKLKFDF